MEAPNDIHGFQIHSSSYMCVCVLSQVYSKLQIVYTEALRSLTHIPPSMPTSRCGVKLYPWHVFCISHYKIALAETQERLKCSGEANQAASERLQSKRDFKQLPLLWVREKITTRGVHSLETSLV